MCCGGSCRHSNLGVVLTLSLYLSLSCLLAASAGNATDNDCGNAAEDDANDVGSISGADEQVDGDDDATKMKRLEEEAGGGPGAPADTEEKEDNAEKEPGDERGGDEEQKKNEDASDAQGMSSGEKAGEEVGKTPSTQLQEHEGIWWCVMLIHIFCLLTFPQKRTTS